jgi:hypothetical protein
MSIPRTVAEVLREHVTLEVEAIDRMYLWRIPNGRSFRERWTNLQL